MLGLKQVHHIAFFATYYAIRNVFNCYFVGFTLKSYV